jgi:hypothetical protein
MTPILGILASQISGHLASTSPVLTGLLQWYDANDSTTITQSAGRVSALANKASGYPYTVTQATSGQQPLVVSNAINGKQIIRFVNTRSDYLLNQTPYAPGHGATTMSFFLVVKTNSTTQGGWYMTGRDAGTGGYLPISLLLGGKVEYQTGSGANVVDGTNSISSGTTLLHYVDQSGTAINMKVITNGATDTKSATGGYALDIGGGPGGYTPGLGFNTRGGFADFDLCELLFYAAKLSTSDYNTNVSYLKTKWGIS